MTTCPACQGRGQVIDQPCPACHGTGQAIQQDKVTVRIPRGIPEGTTLRLVGRGTPSPSPGGPAGDAYVIIRTLPDPLFVREAPEPVDLLLCGHHFRVSQAALRTAGAAVYDETGLLIMAGTTGAGVPAPKAGRLVGTTPGYRA